MKFCLNTKGFKYIIGPYFLLSSCQEEIILMCFPTALFVCGSRYWSKLTSTSDRNCPASRASASTPSSSSPNPSSRKGHSRSTSFVCLSVDLSASLCCAACLPQICLSSLWLFLTDSASVYCYSLFFLSF